MKATYVDDFWVNAIKPEVEKIEAKIGKHEPLSHQDINTLLLKSQFNHINHLDMRLDEVVADVSSLKDEFTGLKGEFADLRSDFKELRSEFKVLRADIETTIQKALNKNMVVLIGMMGFFLTLSKFIDTFAK